MISVDGLIKHFGSTRAVDGVSFAIERGEIVGFLGPNGAGKTTTLRVLTCYHPPTRGRAEVAGFDVLRHPIEVRRRIGYLPENVATYPEMRVEEYLLYRATLKGVARRQRRAAVEEAMRRCGVEDVRRKLVGHVSRGYRQRVGLADALVARPPILILDEPTSGLDPNQRRRMKALVRDLAREHTVLFSSHILPEVEDVSSRILVIHRGRIRADGTPRGLLELSRGRRLVVTAALPPPRLVECLAGLAGVAPASAVAAADGFATAEAEVGADADPRDAAFERLRAAGAAVRELKLVLPRLEDFFQSITEAEDEAAERGGSGEAA
jgi:ABC-2 type transport system ATP-binding protein